MDKVISIQIKQDKLKGTIPDPDDDQAFDEYFDEDKKISKEKENKIGIDMMIDAENTR
jgi:hypothetical protein